jgi:predicted transposase/invertase (TIGR01784 family)
VKRDAIFYTLFQRFPSLLFALLEQPPIGAQTYRFESVEVKEPTFRIDGVFLPSEDASPKIVFFAEVQFQKDEALYHRFFSESLLYLYRNRSLYDDWHGVVIFYSRSLEPENTAIHRALLNSGQVTRIYLNELSDPSQQPIGIQLMQLTIAPEDQAIDQVKQLIQQARQTEMPTLARNEIIEIIATIAIYKFANRSREEVETMLGLNIEEGRLYREIKAEGERAQKLKLVPRLLAEGISIERVAALVELSVEEVRQAAQPSQTDH